MPYGTLKVDTVTFTSSGVDKSVTLSGLIQNPVFSGAVTSTSTISGVVIQGGTLVSGLTITGSAGQFTTITGGTASFTTVTGGTVSLTSGVFASGTAAAPSISIGTTTNGLYSTGTNQLAISTGGTGRLFVAADGRVGVGAYPNARALEAVSPQQIVETLRSTSAGAFLAFQDAATASDSVVRVGSAGSDLLAFAGSMERARVDSSGRLLVGTSTARTTFFGSTVTPVIQLEQSSLATVFSIVRNSADNGDPIITLCKTRGTTNNSNTIVAADDFLGGISFQGADGVNLFNAATIRVNVDGSPGLNSMPGRITFNTTPSGATSVVERLRITSDGKVGIGTSAPSELLHLVGNALATGGFFRTAGSSAAAASTRGFRQSVDGSEYLAIYYDNSGAVFNVAGSERARIDSSGRLLVGTSTSINQLGFAHRLQVVGTTGSEASTGLLNFNTAQDSAPYFTIGHSRNALGAFATAAVAGDLCGVIAFASSNGTDMRHGAAVLGYADGTWAANSHPGRLVFSTTSSGSATPVERMRINNSGKVGIGSIDPAVNLLVANNIEGGTTSFGSVINGTIQSGVTANATIFATGPGTAAAAFTLADLRHFSASQGTIGAGSTVVSQYGFIATAGLTGATNNYGFFSNISAATGRWAFYSAGTADSYFASNNFIFANGGTERARVDSSGRLLVGTSTARSLAGDVFKFYIEGVEYTNASGAFINNSNNANPAVFALCKSRGTAIGAVTSVANGDNIGRFDFLAADGTGLVRSALIGAQVDGTPATGSMPGRLVFSTTPAGSATPVERMRISSNGNALFGRTYSSSERIGIGGGTANIATGTTATGFFDDTTVSSAQTGTYTSHLTYVSTQAAAFTLANLTHYKASQFTIGAGSAVTNQTGFYADGNLTGATNNYGFRSDIASGTGRWNFYAAGTAANYFTGAVQAKNFTINATDVASNVSNGIFAPVGNELGFVTNATERARIDSSGRLLVGTSTARSNLPFAFGNTAARLQVEGTGEGLGAFAVVQNYDSATIGVPAVFNLARSGATSIGSNTVIASGNQLGEIQFSGSDGTNFVRAASIRGEVDGTPGLNDMPGRLIFSTTADGAATPTERMRIDNAGRLFVGTAGLPAASSSTSLVHIYGNTQSSLRLWGTNQSALILQRSGDIWSANDYNDILWQGTAGGGTDRPFGRIRVQVTSASGVGSPTFMSFYTNGDSASDTERMRLNSQGELLIGTTTRTANGGVLQISNGITFPGTQSACSDPNTLDDYEEGTWTPTQGAGLTVVGAYSSQGFYTKTGNVVCVFASLFGATSIASSALGILCGGLPFTPAPPSSGYVVGSMTNQAGNISNTCFSLNTANVYGAVAIAANSGIHFSMTYRV